MSVRARVLIIDDDFAHLDFTEEMIGEYFDVMVALSGAQALGLLRGCEAPDLILLDIDMPGMNGYQTYAKIREIEAFHDIPIVFLTGMTNSEAELHGLTLGAQDYITKPFDKEVLLARVRLRLKEALRIRQMRDRLRESGMDEDRFSALTHELTPAEHEVARLIAIGFDNQEIARQLHYTAGYVRNLATLAYDKLNVHGRQELRAMFRKR